MDTAHLWLFFGLVFSIVILPGVDMAFVLGSALVGGRRAGLASRAGPRLRGDPQVLEFVHRAGASPCPQIVGQFEVCNELDREIVTDVRAVASAPLSFGPNVTLGRGSRSRHPRVVGLDADDDGHLPLADDHSRVGGGARDLEKRVPGDEARVLRHHVLVEGGRAHDPPWFGSGRARRENHENRDHGCLDAPGAEA